MGQCSPVRAETASGPGSPSSVPCPVVPPPWTLRHCIPQSFTTTGVSSPGCEHSTGKSSVLEHESTSSCLCFSIKVGSAGEMQRNKHHLLSPWLRVTASVNEVLSQCTAGSVLLMANHRRIRSLFPSPSVSSSVLLCAGSHTVVLPLSCGTL